MPKRYLLPILALFLVFLSKCGGSSELHANKGGGGFGATLSQAGEGGDAEDGGRVGAAEGGADTVGTGGSVTAGDSGEPFAGASGTGGDSEPTLLAVEVTPGARSVAVGTEALLVATARFADGSTANVSARAVWVSSAPTVVSVAAGTVTGVAPGNAIVSATLENVTGSSSITVPTATVVSLDVTPSTAAVGIQGNVAFRAVVTLSDASTQDVTETADWSSSDPSIATVSGGVAVGLRPGTVTLGAAAGGRYGQATLTVSSATLVSIAVTPANATIGIGTQLAFQATGTFSDGSTADVSASAVWTSTDAGVATFDAELRTATGTGAGSTEITATVASMSGATRLSVTAASLVSITVTPIAATLAVNGTLPLVAVGTYSDGSSVDLTASVLWTSDDSSVAAVSNAAGSQGIVLGLSGGTAAITASLQSVTGTATLTVTSAELVSISISPQSSTSPISITSSFVAIGTYADGSEADITSSVTWSTTDSNVATISNAIGSQGLLTAVGEGTTRVSASLGAVRAEATVTVTSATLVSIAVSPANLTLSPGASRSMTAIGTFSDNSTVDLTTSVVWSSSDTAAVVLSNASGSKGALSAVDVGTATVSATLGGIAGSTTVTVADATLTEIVVEPIAVSVPAGQAVRYTATAIFSDNSQRDVTNQATWSSSDEMVAILEGGGGGPGTGGGQVASTLLAGTTTIAATYQGIQGSTTLTVTSATLSEIVVTPINPTLPIGRTQQLVATAIYSDYTSQNITGQATWTSSATAVAQVSTGGGGPGGPGGPGGGAGVVTAIAQGTATLTASWGDLGGSTVVTVTMATITSIAVSPIAASVAVGAQQQFTAQAIYSDNTSVDVTQAATWLSSDDAVAGVSDAGGPGSAKGLAKALATGSTTISASYASVTGNASLTVTAATLVRVDITPVEPSVAAGAVVQFVATALYNDNTTRTVTSESTWTSSNPSIAQVSTAAGSRGFTQTFENGDVTINATYGGVKGATTLHVTSATLTTIDITPFEPTLLVGIPLRLAATGIYSDFTFADLTNLVTWTSSDTAVVSVSNANGTRGQATPLAAGAAIVNATYQGVTGQNSVSVSTASIVSIAVTPSTATIAPHSTQPFTAIATLSDETTLDVTTYVTWLSSTPAVAAISNAGGSQGAATGLTSGTVTITAVRGSVSGTAVLTVD